MICSLEAKIYSKDYLLEVWVHSTVTSGKRQGVNSILGTPPIKSENNIVYNTSKKMIHSQDLSNHIIYSPTNLLHAFYQA